MTQSMQDEETPLHVAAQNGLENTVQELINCKADVNLRNAVSALLDDSSGVEALMLCSVFLWRMSRRHSRSPRTHALSTYYKCMNTTTSDNSTLTLLSKLQGSDIAILSPVSVESIWNSESHKFVSFCFINQRDMKFTSNHIHQYWLTSLT